MANTKRIIIEGDLPYDCGGSALWLKAEESRRDAAQQIQRQLAYMAGPVSGVHIGWTRTSVRTMPSGIGGGQLSFYGFRISGSDSLRREWVDQWMVATTLLGGRINYVYVKDLDAPELLYDIGEKRGYGKEADPALRLWVAGLVVKEYPGLEFSV